MIGSPRRREAWLRAAGLRPRSPLFLLVGSVSVGRQGSVVQRGQQELQLFEGTAVATHLVGLGLHHVAQVLQLLEARLALLEPASYPKRSVFTQSNVVRDDYLYLFGHI